jgi:hypothetical protein
MAAKWDVQQLIKVLVKMQLEQCASTKTMLDYLMDEEGYEISRSYQLIKEAQSYIAEINKNWAINALEIRIAELQEQRESAKQVKDRRLVLEITKELSRVQSLYEEKMTVTHHVFDVKIKGLE